MGIYSGDADIFHGTQRAFDSIRLPTEDLDIPRHAGDEYGVGFYTAIKPDNPEIAQEYARSYTEGNGLVLQGRISKGQTALLNLEENLGSDAADRLRAQVLALDTGNPELNRYYQHVAEGITADTDGRVLWNSLSEVGPYAQWHRQQHDVTLDPAQTNATLRADRRSLAAALEPHGIELVDIDSLSAEQLDIVKEKLRGLNSDNPIMNRYYNEVADSLREGMKGSAVTERLMRADAVQRSVTSAIPSIDNQDIADKLDRHATSILNNAGLDGVIIPSQDTAVFKGRPAIDRLPDFRVAEVVGHGPSQDRIHTDRKLAVGEVLIPSVSDAGVPRGNSAMPGASDQQQQQETGWRTQQQLQQQQQQQQQRQSFDGQTAEEISARQMEVQQRQLAENLARQATAEPANVEPRVAVDNTLTRMQEPSQGVRVNANPELAAAQLEIQRQLQAAASEAVERRSDDSVGSRLRGAAEAGALEGGIKPAGSLLSAAQQRLHSAIAADPSGRVFDALAQQQAEADGVTVEEAATREPRADGRRIENPRLPEIAARAAGTGVRNPYGIEQDRTPRILAEPGNARPGGASTASLFPASFEGAATDLHVGQGTVGQLRPTSQLRSEVAEILPADRNASVDRVINRDAGSVLPVAANDTGVTPRSVNTTAPTAPATAANDGATVTVDSAAVSAAVMAAAAAGSDGVHPVAEPHRTSGANRAMGGAGFAMSTQMIQAIQEKLARGEEVSTAEYIAAGVNVGYSALDTAGVTAIDDAVAGQLGRLAPRLAKVGGPLVQAALAVPMIYSASETGDPKAIGAASFGAIGGIGAGMAGQALIPIPGVGFVVGVVVGEGAAHVGGLAADAMYNEDPAKREAAVKELQQIQRDYIPNPLDPLRAPGATINLAGAAVSSVGRAVNTIGEVASWGGEQLGGLADSTQQSVSQGLGRYLPAGAADVIGKVAVAPMRVNAATLQAAGAVVSAVGTGVDMVGQGAEAVGHTANRAADETKRVAVAAATETVRVAGRATEEFGRTFTREYQRDPSVRGAARATVAATVDVAERAGNYAVRRANEAYESGREMVSAAGSWLADRTPSWLGGNVGRDRDDDETPARRAPAARRPAAPAAPSRVTISQQALDGLERAGWTKKLDLNGDGQLSVAEVNAAFRKHGITARQADDDRSGTLSAQEISQDLNNAIRSRRAPASGRS